MSNTGTRSPSRRSASWAVVLGIVLVVLVIGVKSCTVVVPAGHRGVVFARARGGVMPKSLDEGLHFYVPFDQSIDLIDVRSQTFTSGAKTYRGEISGGDPIGAKSSDGQDVTVEITLRFRLDPEKVWRVRQNVGSDVIGKIIKPEIRSHVRSVIAGEKGIEIYSLRRRAIQKAIFDRLSSPETSALPRSDILVEDVLVRNIKFSDQFQAAIERKQIAMQEAQRAEYILQKKRKEKEERIIKAEGESKAIAKKGAALAAYPELVKYEYVHNLPEDVRVVIADSKAIINMSELFPAAAPAPQAPARPAP
jgi:regulator of protease activity HflC (stomatin/prohibitin superfamily)